MPPKEFPVRTSFYTTEELKRCAQILCRKMGISYVMFLHKALEAFVTAHLKTYYGGISPQEFIVSQEIPQDTLEVEAA